MKTFIAAPVISTFASILPVAVSEAASTLRWSEDVVSSPSDGKDAKAPVASAETPPAKKIRVVLASPYGN